MIETPSLLRYYHGLDHHWSLKVIKFHGFWDVSTYVCRFYLDHGRFYLDHERFYLNHEWFYLDYRRSMTIVPGIMTYCDLLCLYHNGGRIPAILSHSWVFPGNSPGISWRYMVVGSILWKKWHINGTYEEQNEISWKHRQCTHYRKYTEVYSIPLQKLHIPNPLCTSFLLTEMVMAQSKCGNPGWGKLLQK